MVLPENLKKRVNPKRRPQRRYQTGIETFDAWTCGLPHGLTTFYGQEGCGKSMMARAIACRAERCLYFTTEVQDDAPNHDEFQNVDLIDYTTFLPTPANVFENLKIYISELKPTLVVLDSLTGLLSGKNPAVPEADIRKWTAEIHTHFQGVVPIIGISEVRGVGFNEQPAGGKAVAHMNSMLIRFEHDIVSYDSKAQLLGAKIGDNVYTLRVVKDKHGLANTSFAKVRLDAGSIWYPIVEKITSKLSEPNGQKKKVWDSDDFRS